jgi:hypothetical protein
MSFTRDIYRLSFEMSPIILCDGIASEISGGMLPIVAITQASSFITALLTGGNITNMDQFFARWRSMPGTQMINAKIGQYPFANQNVAANAVIADPNVISFQMQCPVNQELGYMNKFATLSALQATLQAHQELGGTYTCITPACMYEGCILERLTDVTDNTHSQAGAVWRWDFSQPLVSESSAAGAISSLMSKIDSGDKVTSSSWSNATSALGNTAVGAQVSQLVSGITGLAGTLSDTL